MISHSQQKVKNISESSQNLGIGSKNPQIFIYKLNINILNDGLNYLMR